MDCEKVDGPARSFPDRSGGMGATVFRIGDWSGFRPSSAVIPGARVTLTDEDKGTSLTSVTEASGRYLFRGVPPAPTKSRPRAGLSNPGPDRHQNRRGPERHRQFFAVRG